MKIGLEYAAMLALMTASFVGSFAFYIGRTVPYKLEKSLSCNEYLNQERAKLDSIYNMKIDSLQKVYENKLEGKLK